MLPSPSILLPSSLPKHRVAQTAISAVSGQLLIVSVRRSRLYIPCFCEYALFFLINTETISSTYRDALLLLETDSPYPASTVVISSVGTPAFFSSLSFISQSQIFSLQHQGGSWCIRNFSLSPHYQPSAEPPKLPICQNLSIDTTRSPPNPRSTGVHHSQAYILCHRCLELHLWNFDSLYNK